VKSYLIFSLLPPFFSKYSLNSATNYI